MSSFIESYDDVANSGAAFIFVGYIRPPGEGQTVRSCVDDSTRPGLVRLKHTRGGELVDGMHQVLGKLVDGIDARRTRAHMPKEEAVVLAVSLALLARGSVVTPCGVGKTYAREKGATA